MLTAVPDVLARIVEHKKTELAGLREHTASLEKLAAESVTGRRDFHRALISHHPAIISEIKKASPSKGLLSADFDPARIARSYETGGAAALSVLTDRRFFQGSFDDLALARSTVGIPVLRKDFTLEELHVIEAAAHSADAILLIAAILTTEELRRLRELATQLKLSALVEVHDEHELNRAIDSGAKIIGVNNRNLHNFEVTLDTSLALAARIPQSVVKVSESGIHAAADVQLLRGAGYQAFLVGEHLMKAPDPSEALRCLLA